MQYKFLIFLFLIQHFFSADSFAQTPIIQKGYFQYPFNPGTQQTLSGSMGELRTNHFHGGL